MNELHAILEAWGRLPRANQGAVLATVVHVTGSAYRRPGARMLVGPEGERTGSVSGGCLEGDIARKAWWLTEGGAPVVRTYDTTSDDDAMWAFGLGCSGVVRIMLERTDSPRCTEMLGFLAAQRASGAPAAVATVIRADPGSAVSAGDRLLFDGSPTARGALVGSVLEEEVRARAAEALHSAESCLLHLGGTEIFIEWIGPPLSLTIFGAGDDAVPLVAIAKQLGWFVTVADGRPAYVTPERFSQADRVLVLSNADLLHGIGIGASAAVVLMTHNYPLDARLLPLVLARRPQYLGLLGPRSRTEQLFATLGVDVPPGVHAPVGLDIGGDTPAAAALSIVAEVQAAIHRRAGGMLKLRREAIHREVVEVGATAPRRSGASVRPACCEVLIGSHV